MTIKEYYFHARALGNFRAADALKVAKAAYLLDLKLITVRPTAEVWNEKLPDGTGELRASAGVRVY